MWLPRSAIGAVKFKFSTLLRSNRNAQNQSRKSRSGSNQFLLCVYFFFLTTLELFVEIFLAAIDLIRFDWIMFNSEIVCNKTVIDYFMI